MLLKNTVYCGETLSNFCVLVLYWAIYAMPALHLYNARAAENYAGYLGSFVYLFIYGR